MHKGMKVYIPSKKLRGEVLKYNEDRKTVSVNTSEGVMLLPVSEVSIWSLISLFTRILIQIFKKG